MVCAVVLAPVDVFTTADFSGAAAVVAGVLGSCVSSAVGSGSGGGAELGGADEGGWLDGGADDDGGAEDDGGADDEGGAEDDGGADDDGGAEVDEALAVAVAVEPGAGTAGKIRVAPKKRDHLTCPIFTLSPVVGAWTIWPPPM